MRVFSTGAELREHLKGADDIGFVPTMGALHRGHISLVESCRSGSRTTVVSIFVNPTQFNDPDDLRNYPRTLEKDLAMLETAGADAVFVPSAGEIYPEPDTRVFDFGRLDKVMEGAARPGHFNGVAQVVSRLFDMVKPRKAYFGEKDFQQIAVVKALVRQMSYGIEIVECPTVRDRDGLALSSRNALLDAPHRAAAPEIYAALEAAGKYCRTVSPAEAERRIEQQINRNPLLNVIYVNIVDPLSLERIGAWNGSARACVAVRAGNVRLIDNKEL